MASNHGPRRDLSKQRLWQCRVAQWRRSGLSVREFCERESLSQPAFYSWRRELARRERSEAPAAGLTPRRAAQAAAFVPVQIVTPRPTGQAAAIEIVLPRGRRVRVRPGFDRDTLQAVLDLLEHGPC
jgi:transposase-like protein